MNDDDITFELDTTDTITLDLDSSSIGDINIDTSSWDDSFTTSPSSIYSIGDTSNGNGNVSIEGELTVGGVDVMQSIKDMQRVLGVVSRDIDKEEKYAGLKRAAEAYERELEKIETFETLKDSK